VDFCTKFGLDSGIAAKEKDAPAKIPGLAHVLMRIVDNGLHQRGRRGFMASDQESHHLVNKFLVGEAAGFESNRDDVDTSHLLLVHSLALTPDHIPASLLDELVGFDDFLVAFITIWKIESAMYTWAESLSTLVVWNHMYLAIDVQNALG
jgi:hypothetical protein